MSHNLTCDEVELWQTPTWVTDICLSIRKAGNMPDGGWEGVLFRYKAWIQSHSQGRWNNREAFNAMNASIDEHMKVLDKAVKSNGSLTFRRS